MNNEQLKQQIDEQNTRIQYLEGIILTMAFSDRFVFSKHLQFLEGRNIQCGKGTGTKIGLSTSEKIAMYGKTPVVQAGAIGAPTSPGGTYAQAEAQSAVTAINSIRTALQNIGIIA